MKSYDQDKRENMRFVHVADLSFTNQVYFCSGGHYFIFFINVLLGDVMLRTFSCSFIRFTTWDGLSLSARACV